MGQTLGKLIALLSLVSLTLSHRPAQFEFDFVERHGNEVWAGCKFHNGLQFDLYEGQPNLKALVNPRFTRGGGKGVNATLVASGRGDWWVRLDLGDFRPD